MTDTQHETSFTVDRNFVAQHAEVAALAEEVLGQIPEWFLTNKENIEQRRQKFAELTAQYTEELERILSQYPVYDGSE